MPADVISDSVTQDPIAAPGGVEFSESNSARSITIPAVDIFPGDPCVVLKPSPYAPGDCVEIPVVVVEALVVSGDPDFPQCQTSQE